MPTGGKGNDTMENTTTINISKEANITGKGTHRTGNCHAVIAPELFEARTSQTDMATCLHTSIYCVSDVIQGHAKRTRVYKRDENGNLNRIGWTTIYRANDPRAVEALLKNGKKLLKEKEELVKENEELKEKAAAWDANKDKLQELNNANDELAVLHAYRDQKRKVEELAAESKALKEQLMEIDAQHIEAVLRLNELAKAL